MLERWILTGPVISRVLDAFTETIDVEVEDTVFPHHEEGQASQERFRCHFKDLLDVLVNRGNPFENYTDELVTLDNKVCLFKSPGTSVHTLESLGRGQVAVRLG